jgi:hypothetical protein
MTRPGCSHGPSSRSHRPRVERATVTEAVRGIEFTGIAYGRPTRWDVVGDNLATGTLLYTAQRNGFQPVSSIDRPDPGSDRLLR